MVYNMIIIFNHIINVRKIISTFVCKSKQSSSIFGPIC
nr:MAG TPA: hypothetical protein [Caudoviricetes sp.]